MHDRLGNGVYINHYKFYIMIYSLSIHNSKFCVIWRNMCEFIRILRCHSLEIIAMIYIL